MDVEDALSLFSSKDKSGRMSAQHAPSNGISINNTSINETLVDGASDLIGLTTEEAETRLVKYGRNRLPEQVVASVYYLFLRQFLSPFIYILLIAAIASFALGQTPSGTFIVVVLLLNAAIGTVQEYGAERAAAALRKMVKGEAQVMRDGKVQRIDLERLVPGDLVLLSSGDKVPADMTLWNSHNLKVDESMLTGESLAVLKDANAAVAGDEILSEQLNRCFAGTIVTGGRAQGIVTHTALSTELGKIADQAGHQQLAEPPLMIRIRRFTYQVAAIIFVGIVLLVSIMLLRGGYDSQGMILMAIGLAVSTIPEGLPAALTVALAIGMRRMAKLNVIIRTLFAVEALGSCTFICSDKTGTLTVNELTIRKVVLPGGTSFDISGEGVGPHGEVRGNGSTQQLSLLCRAGVFANESHLDYAGGEWVSNGDIVDVAFLVFAKKLGLSLSCLRKDQPQLDVIPYESERAYSGSVNVSVDGTNQPVLYVKGSPEKIVQSSTSALINGNIESIDTAKIQADFEQLASQGYRVLALAYRPAHNGDVDTVLRDMIFLGLVAMMDPVRPEAYNAVKQCRDGGVDVAMVTGDHPATAKAIALELGLCSEAEPVITGSMIRAQKGKPEHEIDQFIQRSRVFARIEPQQKVRIVESFVRAEHFVAVTGDGVNDALAMRAASASIAMGKGGTDVARETADLIITDDNFASIVAGVEQGRIVYNNIRKVIALLIATGFSALMLFFCTATAGLPMPLTAVQLLWLNLVANGLQDVGLAFEPKEGGELEQPPRQPKEAIFERRIIEHVLITGSIMGALAFVLYAYLIESGTQIEQARNLVLMLMVLFGNIHALNSRSETRSIFQLPLLSNVFLICVIPLAQLVHIGAMYLPGLSDVLEIHPITLTEWAKLLSIALSLLFVEEIHKAWLRHKR